MPSYSTPCGCCDDGCVCADSFLEGTTATISGCIAPDPPTVTLTPTGTGLSGSFTGTAPTYCGGTVAITGSVDVECVEGEYVASLSISGSDPACTGCGSVSLTASAPLTLTPPDCVLCPFSFDYDFRPPCDEDTAFPTNLCLTFDGPPPVGSPTLSPPDGFTLTPTTPPTSSVLAAWLWTSTEDPDLYLLVTVSCNGGSLEWGYFQGTDNGGGVPGSLTQTSYSPLNLTGGGIEYSGYQSGPYTIVPCDLSGVPDPDQCIACAGTVTLHCPRTDCRMLCFTGLNARDGEGSGTSEDVCIEIDPTAGEYPFTVAGFSGVLTFNDPDWVVTFDGFPPHTVGSGPYDEIVGTTHIEWEAAYTGPCEPFSDCAGCDNEIPAYIHWAVTGPFDCFDGPSSGYLFLTDQFTSQICEFGATGINGSGQGWYHRIQLHPTSGFVNVDWASNGSANFGGQHNSPNGTYDPDDCCQPFTVNLENTGLCNGGCFAIPTPSGCPISVTYTPYCATAPTPFAAAQSPVDERSPADAANDQGEGEKLQGEAVDAKPAVKKKGCGCGKNKPLQRKTRPTK